MWAILISRRSQIIELAHDACFTQEHCSQSAPKLTRSPLCILILCLTEMIVDALLASTKMLIEHRDHVAVGCFQKQINK